MAHEEVTTTSPPAPATQLDAIKALLTRTSVGALKEPAPPREVLELALRCAIAAPDHGRLMPARFIVIEGEGRNRFGKICADALRHRQPDAAPDLLDRETKKPLRAPMIIMAICSPKKDKIPEIEQMLSVGAAVENLLLALHAKGFGAMWRTGDAVYDQNVKLALGLSASEHIVGLVYTGTPATAARRIERPYPEAAVRHMSS